jgi:hypothetical protein
MSYWWGDNSSRHHHWYSPPDFMDLYTDWGCSPHCGQEDVGQIWFRSFRGFLCHCMQSVLVICFFVWRGVGGVIGSNQYYYGE